MKKNVLLSLVVAIGFFTSAFSYAYEALSANELHVMGDVDVRLVLDKNTGLSQQEGFQLNTRLVGEALHIATIETDEPSARSHVLVKLTDIKVIVAENGAKVTGEAIKSSNLFVKANNEGAIDLTGEMNLTRIETNNGQVRLYWVDSPELTVKATGNSHVFLSGIVDTLFLNGSDKSDVDLRYLNAKQAFIEGKNNAQIFVAATNALNVRASGNSNVAYFRKPAVLSSNVSQRASVIDWREE